MRVSYTAQRKLAALAFLSENGMTATLLEYNISKSMLYGWKKTEEQLKSAKRGQRSFRAGKPKHVDIEAKLREWVLEKRSRSRALRLPDIQRKALEEARRIGDHNFKASNEWVQNFMSRNGFSIRRRTSVGQTLPTGYRQKVADFRNFVRDLSSDITPSSTGNVDEIPVAFDMVHGRTVAVKGSEDVKIDSTGNEKRNFTVVLGVTASGEKLMPMIIFKKKLIPKGQFPPRVIIKANEKGWMNETLMVEWFHEVWAKRDFNDPDPTKSLLIMDSARCHLTDRVKRERKMHSKAAIIPGGLTRFCQPLDVSVNKVFKDNLRKLWEEWMSDNSKASFTRGGRRRGMGYAEVANMVEKAFYAISEETIVNGFVKALFPKPDQGEEGDDDDEEDHEEQEEDKGKESPAGEGEEEPDREEEDSSEDETELRF